MINTQSMPFQIHCYSLFILIPPPTANIAQQVIRLQNSVEEQV